MTVHPYHHKLARTLERMGATYTVSDLLVGIANGQMQSFADGDSWAITHVIDFPRARMLEIIVAIGNLERCRRLHDRILQYARDNDISLIQAYGRRGWIGDARERGWKVKTTSYLYQREL